jgi:hypothetical protein
MELKEWHEIKSEYTDTLIIGNGASAAISKYFQYNNLYEHGREHGHLNSSAQKVFDQFTKKSRDFEGVLYRLWQADFINQKFELVESERKKVRKAYTDVRRALINTVKEIHPSQAKCGEERLTNIGRFMAQFSTVFSLNYDLIIYWALLNAKKVNDWKYSDGFTEDPTHQSSKSIPKRLFDFQFSGEPKLGQTKIFYPHGNLALYQTKGGEESKLMDDTDGLLNSITKRWSDNDGQPIFVCEGSAEDKISTITKSPYLSHVFQQALPSSKESITIYGWSLGEQDSHILKQLALTGCKRAAVSIYSAEKSEQQLDKETDGMLEMLRTHAGINQVDFFNAKSVGCWANTDRKQQEAT